MHVRFPLTTFPGIVTSMDVSAKLVWLESTPASQLSCITISGPATYVVWTRDGMPVTEDGDHITAQEVVNGVTAEYLNTLTVRGSVHGTYTCTVSNDRMANPLSEDLLIEGLYLPALCWYS